MPHLVEATPSTKGLATAGIGTGAASQPSALASASTHASESVNHPQPSAVSDLDLNNDDNNSDDNNNDDDNNYKNCTKKKHRRDLFSMLPATTLQQILAHLPPFQMLVISELSRKFYNFVVLGQEMNEVWFRLVKEEEAEQKKKLDWYKQKMLEHEQRSVQMMRSFSGSSTCSNMSTDDQVVPLSKQAQRNLNKKQEAAGKSTTAKPVKAMKRADRKRNWCKVYVDSVLRGLGDDPLESLNQVASGGAKKPAKFQTLVLNESLPQEHLKEYSAADKDHDSDKEMSREAKTQAKVEKRMFYKSIRSKPKGKKAGQLDSSAAKLEKISPWRQPEWSEQDQVESGDFY
ncbi:hypothetical protein KVV02_004373 [Mortierella alpina]|uniref:F-box domain-containing protein n=1 Tax=Mortierella alpina TaxID=64518 RepID=A0A9P8A2Y5_MORAP|nr:hypothetical protein KVV02_004373 [Mortierella alpina]